MTQKRLPRGAALFALGGALGLAVFLLVFGLSPLDVANDAFCRGGFIEKDIQQHYAGWLFYRESAAAWPLGVTQSINRPDGLSVAFTDSVPLLAVLLRPLANALGGTFQYFGWFTLVCFVLQGGFGALLCGLFAGGTARPLLGAALFVTSPILWERVFRHTSLGAQWLLLAALYFYFAARRRGRAYSAGLFFVNVLAVGIHPYFLPMTYAVTLALVLHAPKRARGFAALGANLGCTALLAWALGFFYGGASSGGQALYGYFSMNLNALVNPVGVNGVRFSRLLPSLGQTNGNYDAFAYLGLGVLAALAAALAAHWRRLGAPVRRHAALCAVCAVLTAFAVSNTVTLGSGTLFTLPLPAALVELFSVFRSGGRLFWVVYDLLTLAAFVGVCRLPLPRRAGPLAAAALAAVQVWDVSPALLQRGEAMRAAQTSEAFPTALQSDFWGAAASYAHIASMDGVQDDALHLALFAADQGMTTNDPFAARYNETTLAEQRQSLLDELADGTLREDTLYLFSDEGAFLQAVEPVKELAWCGRVQGGDCSWYVIAPGLQGQSFDALCTPYDEDYPLRLADYTDALWNRGVLDSTKKTVCFADSPFTRARLSGASFLVTAADGARYEILSVDDSDPGWLMVTLDIDDATVLWDKELETE